MGRIVDLLIVLDTWVNEYLLNGWHRETISSRCGKAQFRSLTRRYEETDALWLRLGWWIDFWFVWDGGWHCIKCIQWDVGRPVA